VSGLLDEYRGDGPLRDLTVLDLSQMMMGPVATQLLGDLGALVIKVERPDGGEWERGYLPQGHRVAGESPYFLAMNRNKLGLAVDLKDEADKARLLELVPHVDAVVHNFRPGVVERLGLGWEALRELNPRLVHASGSGYGPRGPWVARPGQDLLVQAASGLAADSGPGTVPPVPCATPIVDAATGFLLAFAVVSAVFEARQTGHGRQVEASLLGTALLMQCQQALVTMNTALRYERSRTGIAAPWTDAPYGVFETADGWLTMSMVEPRLLARLVDLPEELSSATGARAYAVRDDIVAAVRAQLKARTTEEWLTDCAGLDIWASPVLTLEEVLAHPQVAANGYVESVPAPGGGTLRAVGHAVAFSGLGPAGRLPAPRVGEHTEVVWGAVESAAGGSGAGDATAGSPAAGDPATMGPAAGNSAARYPAAGCPAVGDAAAADSAAEEGRERHE
jgi:crotonobetainyl-CoA:carnitine CoA-transferase CaiB-like acyl-CoA transferase